VEPPPKEGRPRLVRSARLVRVAGSPHSVREVEPRPAPHAKVRRRRETALRPQCPATRPGARPCCRMRLSTRRASRAGARGSDRLHGHRRGGRRNVPTGAHGRRTDRHLADPPAPFVAAGPIPNHPGPLRRDLSPDPSVRRHWAPWRLSGAGDPGAPGAPCMGCDALVSRSRVPWSGERVRRAPGLCVRVRLRVRLRRRLR
jgi:hypothetical protein